MPDVMTQHNIGALVDIRRMSDHSTATAGGTGAATQVVGLTVDRMGFSGGALPQSGLFSVLFETTLGAVNTTSLATLFQHSIDGSSWTDYQAGAAAVIATGPTGGGTIKGQLNVQVDITGANRYVRFNYTPTFSAANTDTFYADAVGAFGGFSKLPAPNT